MNNKLKEKIAEAPKAPGCYLFKDSRGIVIYVGKSKLIHNRVRQYFQKSSQIDEKRQSLARNIRDVEFLVTDTETDALIQEYRLIKAHKPWYNTQLKADRKYACIKITNETPYRAFCVIEEQGDRQKGDLVFGYFRNKDDARNTLESISQAYKTPVCGQSGLGRQKNACLRYHLQQCAGACIGMADEKRHEDAVSEIASLLKGRRTAVFPRLKRAMEERSTALDFEGAARMWNLADSLETIRKRSRRLLELPQDKDVIVFLRAYGEDRFSLFYLRRGKTVTRQDFSNVEELDPEAVSCFLKGRSLDQNYEDWMSRCLVDIYADKQFVVLPRAVDDEKLLQLIRKEHRKFILTKD